jgi:RNA polymerase sigma-70 factor, ECF subfamily
MPFPETTLEAWRACYDELAPKLLLYARQWTACQADAEDVVQSAFVRFWKARPNAQPEHYPLLYSAVRSAALDLHRTAERRSAREATYHAEEAPDAWFDPTVERQEEAALLEGALNRLPSEQREVVVLRIWGDLTFAQIATTTGDSMNTVAARYRYGLEALRKHVQSLSHERVGA